MQDDHNTHGVKLDLESRIEELLHELQPQLRSIELGAQQVR